MYEHHLRDMTNLLVKNGLIPKGKANKVNKIFDEYWADKIAITWSSEDVIGRAKEKGKEISEEKAREILQAVLHHHDCCYGVTWDTLDYFIEEGSNG